MSISEAKLIFTDQDVTFCSRLCNRELCFNVTAIVAYFTVLLWRFTGLILFSIHSSDCLLRERHASYRCKNFTLFSHAAELEISWQIASVINCLLVILVLLKIPDYEGYSSALRNHSKFARFWSLFFQLAVTVIFNVIVVYTGSPGMTISKLIGVGFILVEISTVMVVYLWNTVPAPWKDSTAAVFRVAHTAYVLSLLLFILENFYSFVLTSAQAAFQVTGMYNVHGISPSLQAIVVVLNAAEATFNYAMMKFFWNKWFDDQRNLFINDYV